MMKRRYRIKDNKPTGIEKLVALSIITAPFTAWRFSFFGISEIFFIFIVFYTIAVFQFRYKLPKDNLTKYYATFTVLCLVGWAYNWVTGVNSGTTSDAVFNLASYILSAFVMGSIECIVFYKENSFKPYRILRFVFIRLSIIDVVLFVISRFRRSLFGRPLLYYSFFAPFTNNLHQFAMVVVVLPFLGFFVSRNEKKLMKKALFFFLSVFDLYICRETGSFKATMGTFLGCFSMLLLLFLSSEKYSLRQKRMGIIGLIMAVMIFVLIKFNTLLNYALTIFVENDGSGGRESLYGDAFKIIMKYPLFGLGPAAHIQQGFGYYYDAHETFLAAWMSSGIFGVVSLLVLIWKAAKRTMRHPYYFSALVPVFIYAAGGDVLRKTVMWTLIVLIYHAVNYLAEGDTFDETDSYSPNLQYR